MSNKSFGQGFYNLMDDLSVDKDPQSIEITNIDIKKIRAGEFQARRMFNDVAIAELSESIKKNGILSPIFVRKRDDFFEIIAGERRWRAANLAGITIIPTIILSITDEEAMAIGLIENIQRENLNIIEEAEAYHKLIFEFGLTHQQVSDRIGKSRSFISNCMRILDLPEVVKTDIIQGQITFGHAKALLSAATKDVLTLVDKVKKDRLSVRKLENLIDNSNDLVEYEQFADQVLNSVGIVVTIGKSSKNTHHIKFASKSDLICFIERVLK